MARRPVLALLLAIALAAASAAACGGDGDGSARTERLEVVATIAPLGALARAVGGDHVDLAILAKAGVDAHEYEISPDDRKRIEDAAVVLRIGIGDIDAWLDRSVSPTNKRVTTVTDGLTLRRSDDGGDSGTPDPHVWHDPENDMAMCDRIADAFAAADPANAETYRANAAAYRVRLEEVDREIRVLIDGIPAANRKMVTNHDAFGYFIERYGLTFVGAVIPSVSTKGEASAGELAKLVDTVRREGVKTIFAESSVDARVARTLAQEAGVKVVDTLYGDSLGEPGSGADTVDGMLLFNARAIAEALK